jgi:hypothetical protein
MDRSPLLRLAPELRTLIYTFVLTSEYAVTLHDGATQPGLTKTCVQIRRESLPMYFATTRLNAHFVSRVDPLLHFWQSLGTDMVLRMNELCIWVRFDRLCALARVIKILTFDRVGHSRLGGKVSRRRVRSTLAQF